jgi:xanthine dehydrogenase accessory factor
MMSVWPTIERFVAEPGAAALVTLAEAQGSTPREAGARMVVRFAVTWVDARNGAFPSHVPGNVTCVADSEPVRLLARAPDGAFVAVMTHSHALDLDLVAAGLASKRFSYVGLIGSATKRARFAGAMRKIGIPADAIERLTCPIGLTEIRDKAPAAIAAAIVAQLLIVRETMARRLTRDGRGHARSELGRVNDA